MLESLLSFKILVPFSLKDIIGTWHSLLILKRSPITSNLNLRGRKAYCQLRAKRVLSIFKDVPLRTRRVLSLYNVYGAIQCIPEKTEP